MMIKKLRRFVSQYNFPQELLYEREFNYGVLDNKIQVYTERWPSQLSTINVFVNCGSRSESAETSGSAHFLEHLHFKGTEKRQRVNLELDVENMGGNLNAYTSRENTSYTMQVLKPDLKEGIQILQDMLYNSKYNKEELEQERHTIFRELLETQKQQSETLTEYAQLIQIYNSYTAYGDHVMGLPILGSIYNIQNINRDMIVQYHNENYIGQNIVIVCAGDYTHEQFLEQINEQFRKFPQGPKNYQRPNSNKPQFLSRSQLVGAELLEEKPEGLNFGLFWEAPCWKDDDYFAFLLIQRLMDNKPEEMSLEARLYQSANINSFQKLVSKQDNLKMQQTVYTPYNDTGLFGYFFYGDKNSLQKIVNLCQQYFQNVLQNGIQNHELQRAKNKVYLELLQHETQNDLIQAIGNQLLFFERRVTRTEIAQKVSQYDCNQIQNIMKKWLINQKNSTTIWGDENNFQHLIK